MPLTGEAIAMAPLWATTRDVQDIQAMIKNARTHRLGQLWVRDPLAPGRRPGRFRGRELRSGGGNDVGVRRNLSGDGNECDRPTSNGSTKAVSPPDSGLLEIGRDCAACPTMPVPNRKRFRKGGVLWIRVSSESIKQPVRAKDEDRPDGRTQIFDYTGQRFVGYLSYRHVPVKTGVHRGEA